MRRFWIALSFAALFVALPAQAQSICRDGTVSKATGRGACSHHGGVAKSADSAPTPRVSSSSGDIVLPANAAPRHSARASERVSRAADATSAKVWVNTKSGVYHCSGTRWYGVTKNGEYATERQARADGNRPAYGRSCS
jgi:hypothetical protein